MNHFRRMMRFYALEYRREMTKNRLTAAFCHLFTAVMYRDASRQP